MIYEFVYRNNLSAFQACCYHYGPVFVTVTESSVYCHPGARLRPIHSYICLPISECLAGLKLKEKCIENTSWPSQLPMPWLRIVVSSQVLSGARTYADWDSTF